MPELPEVETVCLALSKIVNNSKVQNVELFRNDLRWNVRDSLKLDLEEDILTKPYRRGKYILIPTVKKNILLFHLGMSGIIKITDKKDNLSKHDHFRLKIKDQYNKTFSIIYNDPRRFGYIDFFNKKDSQNHFLLKKLGVEPLSKDLNIDYLNKKVKKSSRSIKNILMDQKIIAGIGNIYASEILHKAKIHPLRIAHSLTDDNFFSIVKATKYILIKAINHGGTSIQNHLQPDGKLGYFVQKLQVYGKGKQKCNSCNNTISKIVISKRSTYYCNLCQN